MVATDSAPVVKLPLTACAPFHPPLALQAVAFVDDQVSVLVEPAATAVGEAVSVKVGAGVVTVTLAVCVALPPAPVQVKVNVVLAVNGALVTVPLTERAPDQPPLAVQEVALVDAHVNATVFPDSTEVGIALNVTVGSGKTVTAADCIADPPAPVQVRMYVAFAVKAAVVSVPLVACVPVHAPLAAQDVALLLLQLKVALDPYATAAGVAVNVTVGTGAITVTVADCAVLPPGPVQVSV